MDVEDWIVSTLVDHGSLSRQRIMALARKAGIRSEITLYQHATAAGVMVHRERRESTWYPPGTQVAEIPEVHDEEGWLINRMGNDPWFRSELLRDARGYGFGAKAITSAKDTLEIVEGWKATKFGPAVTWQLSRPWEEEMRLWLTRKQSLSPLGE